MRAYGVAGASKIRVSRLPMRFLAWSFTTGRKKLWYCP